jgi:hypothetical protein
LVALSFLDIPEIKDKNVVIFSVEDFKKGQVSSIWSKWSVHIVYEFDSQFDTVCIMRCWSPWRFYHFTPLVLSEESMASLCKFLRANPPVPYRKRSLDNDDINVDIPEFDADVIAPIMSETYQFQFLDEARKSREEAVKKADEIKKAKDAKIQNAKDARLQKAEELKDARLKKAEKRKMPTTPVERAAKRSSSRVESEVSGLTRMLKYKVTEHPFHLGRINEQLSAIISIHSNAGKCSWLGIFVSSFRQSRWKNRS